MKGINKLCILQAVLYMSQFSPRLRHTHKNRDRRNRLLLLDELINIGNTVVVAETGFYNQLFSFLFFGNFVLPTNVDIDKTDHV